MPAAHPKVVQVALCSADLVTTVRRYVEVFGFGDGGGEILWGEWLGDLQGTASDTELLMWWLMGRQSMLQLEVFQHSTPLQRPQAPEATVADLGWVRWGFAVPDFDACLDRLARRGVELVTAPREVAGVRRACFRDPDTAVFTEVMEEGATLPGGVRQRDFSLGPSIVYVAVSVADLAVARSYFVDVIGLDEHAPDLIHPVDDDTLWGLAAARRETLVVGGDGMFVEIVAYADPAPRPKPADYRITDQGLMNIAIGFREREPMAALVERHLAAGFSVTVPTTQRPTGNYLRAFDDLSVEVLSLPQELDTIAGFVPRKAPFRRRS